MGFLDGIKFDPSSINLNSLVKDTGGLLSGWNKSKTPTDIKIEAPDWGFSFGKDEGGNMKGFWTILLIVGAAILLLRR